MRFLQILGRINFNTICKASFFRSKRDRARRKPPLQICNHDQKGSSTQRTIDIVFVKPKVHFKKEKASKFFYYDHYS